MLVAGAGPIGCWQRFWAGSGVDVHVLDQVADGPKPDLVRDLGETCHYADIGQVTERVRPDIVVEATGAATARRPMRWRTPTRTGWGGS